MLIHSYTGTGAFHDCVLGLSNMVWFVRGIIPFIGLDKKGNEVTTKTGMNASLVAVLDITHRKPLHIKTLDSKNILEVHQLNQSKKKEWF